MGILANQKFLKLVGSAAILLATTGSAAADPVSIITAILTYFTVNATVAAVVANVIVIAAGIALAIFMTPKPPKPEGGTISVQQDNPPIAFAYGESIRMSGAIAFKEAMGDNLYIIQALAGHEIQFSGTYYFNDDRFTLNASPAGPGATLGFTGVPPRSGYPTGFVAGDFRYNAAFLDTRVGLATETPYDKVAGSLGSGGFSGASVWPATARGDGTASLLSICPSGDIKFFTEHWPVGQPDPSAITTGTRVFDPRDIEQSDADPLTFKFASLGNVGLGIIHYLCFSPYGPQKNYQKVIIPYIDQWLEEIELCDEFIPKKIGNERRYQMAGWTTTEKDDRSTLKTMRESCDGKLTEQGDGSYKFWCGVFREAEFTLTDADIIDFKVSIGRTQPSSGNSFTIKYTSHDNDWSTVPTDPIEWVDDQIEWGQRQPVTWDREWVFSTGQASRLLKRGYLKEKQSVRGSVRVHWSGLAAAYERNVKISSNTLPPRLRNATIEIQKALISVMSGIIILDWIVTSADIDNYNPETDESDPAPVPAKPLKQAYYIPANVEVEPFQQSSSSFVSLDVSFDTPEPTPGTPLKSDYDVRWRVEDIGGGVVGAWNQQHYDNDDIDTSGPRIHLTVAIVPDNIVLQVEVRSVTISKGTPGQWSETIEVDTSSSSVIPSDGLLDSVGIQLLDSAGEFIREGVA